MTLQLADYIARLTIKKTPSITTGIAILVSNSTLISCSVAFKVFKKIIFCGQIILLSLPKPQRHVFADQCQKLMKKLMG